MATREEIFKAVIQINDQEAKNKLKSMEEQFGKLKKRRDEALASGNLDLWKSLGKEMDKLSNNMRKQKSLTEGLSKAMNNISTAKQKELEQIIRTINRHLNSGAVARNSEEWKALNESLKDAKKELRLIKKEGEEQPSVWGKFFKFLNDSWGGVLILFESITGISATVRKTVADYAAMQQEMANVRKYTGQTAEEVAEMNEVFKEINTRTSREELNQLAGAAGRLGIQSKDKILEFVDAADKINVALGDDLGKGAVDNIGKLAMAFGEDEKMGLRKAMIATGSAINDLAQSSAANAGYLVEFAARVAGVGKQLGLTQAQIMGFGAVMDENMLRDEMASTAFSQLLTAMATDAEKFAKFAGVEGKKFADMVRTDINGAVLTLADNMKKQDPSTMLKMFTDMGLDGSRAVGVLANMADKIDDVRKHQTTANQAYAEGVSIQKEFEVQNGTVQAELDKAKKKFHDIAVELGEKLQPIVKYTISGTSMLVKALSKLIEFFTSNWKIITVLTSSILAYVAVVKIQYLWSQRHIVVTKLKAAALFLENKMLEISILRHAALNGTLTKTVALQRLFNNVLKINPYGAAAAAITALVGGYVALATSTGKAAKNKKLLNDLEREGAKTNAEEITKIRLLKDTIENTNTSYGRRKSAIEELQSIVPDFHASLDKEGKLINYNAQVLDVYIKKLKNKGVIETATSRLSEKTLEHDNFSKDLTPNMQEAIFYEKVEGLSESQAAAKANASITAYRVVKKRLADLDSEISFYENKIKSLSEENAKLDSELDNITSPNKPTKPEDGDYVSEKQLTEQQKQMKQRADAAKAEYQSQIAEEMLAYRQGVTTYTDYMEEKHRITQNYYDHLKRIYGEDSAEYKKLLDDREKDEQDYYSWTTKKSEDALTIEKAERKHTLDMKARTMNELDYQEAVFQLEIEFMKKRQSLHKQGSKEWEQIAVQMKNLENQHKLDLEEDYMQRLMYYREQAGQMDYDLMMKLEMMAVEQWADILKKRGQMTEEEYDAIIAHIRQKYAGLKAQQADNKDVEANASKMLENARKTVGAKDVDATDIASGVFSISNAIKNQELINEELKRLYGEDYENNKQYQESKRQLDMETMQQVVAGAQAAYSTISTMLSSVSAYSQACSDLEVAKIEANYEKQIQAAGNNSKKKEKLEKERDEKIAKAKSKANKKAMGMEIAQAFAQTAMAAINAYASASKEHWLLGPIAAAAAVAAGMLQIATIKKQHQAQQAGYYEGGYTGGKRYRREAGVVHEGEFVANHYAVGNKNLVPLFDLIDHAQRNNTVGSLSAADVTNVMGSNAAAVVAPVVNVSSDNTELRAELDNLNACVQRLSDCLEQGIRSYAVIDGPEGLHKQLKKYERLIDK